jgi:flagellar basal body rod protein FlgG
MSTGIWSAVSGAVGQSAALEVAANNIANASTPGFRADRAVFRQELARVMSTDNATRSLRYSVVRSVEPDLESGTIQHTGRQLDAAIRGKDGFFVVSTAQGERYTRAGSVRVTSDGRVTTPEGHAYLGPDRRPLRVSPDATDVSIGPDGALNVNGEPTGRFLFVSFDNPTRLEKDGNVLLRGTAAAGRARLANVELEPGALEMSNSSALAGMTSLVTATRQFDMLARVIEAFSNVDKRAATDIARR